MARLEHRTKAFLKLAVFDYVSKLKANDLHFTDDFKVQSHIYDSNTMHVMITEPNGKKFHYDIKIVEKQVWPSMK